jgi:hypothetical protein
MNMSCLFFNCYNKKTILSKFINEQRKDEYKNNKMNMSYIGNNLPKNVYHGYTLEIDNNNIIQGLNSLCLCDIHIAITLKPSRLILSYINIDSFGKTKRGDTFHIYNINYKTIETINDITQYDIYNAIQDYIYIYKNIPNNCDCVIASC